MRIIAGSARGTKLKTVEGPGTRPTTDRIKETLFNMIQKDMYDCRFLDLFSGSGGIGLEALSRGAKQCYFVEKDKDAAKCIKENIKSTHFEEKAILLECDVIQSIKRLNETVKPFDFVFMDPPYDKSIERDVLEVLKNTDIIDEYTTIIVEASMETKFDYLKDFQYELTKVKAYKTNMHVYIHIKG